MPDERLHLSVGVTHPELGDFFSAVLTGRVAEHPHLNNEQAGWRVLLRSAWPSLHGSLRHVHWRTGLHSSIIEAAAP